MNIVMFCTAYSICSWLHHFTLASPHNGVAWNRRTMVLLEIAAQWCCLKSPYNAVAWNRRTMVLLEIAAQWCCLKLIIWIHISHKVCSFTHGLSVYAELSGSLDKAYTDRCRQLPSGAVPDQLKSGPSTTTSARLTPLGSDYNYLCNFHKADCQPRLKRSAYSGFEIRVIFLLG